jgi:cell wall assembly regulator SMI1
LNNWPRHWLPIGAAGRDNRIALSIAGEDRGAVYLIVEHLWDTGEGAFRVANSFDEFIQLLYNVDEDDE